MMPLPECGYFHPGLPDPTCMWENPTAAKFNIGIKIVYIQSVFVQWIFVCAHRTQAVSCLVSPQYDCHNSHLTYALSRCGSDISTGAAILIVTVLHSLC